MSDERQGIWGFVERKPWHILVVMFLIGVPLRMHPSFETNLVGDAFFVVGVVLCITGLVLRRRARNGAGTGTIGGWWLILPSMVVAVLVGSIVGFGVSEYRIAAEIAESETRMAKFVTEADDEILMVLVETLKAQRDQVEELMAQANDRQVARVEELMAENLDVTDSMIEEIAGRDTLWLKRLVIAGDDKIARLVLGVEEGMFPAVTFFGEGGVGNSRLYSDDTGGALIMQTGDAFVCMMHGRLGVCGLEDGYLQFLD